MGRLIDADEFEKFIKQKYSDSETTNDIKDQMLFDLSCQQIVFDLDKVVEQLKERSEEYNSGVRLHGKPEEMITTEAIEIVKGGGVDERS